MKMKVHQTLEWLNLLSLGTKGLKPRQQSVYNQGSVTGGGWRGQHLNSQQHSLTTLIRHCVSIKTAYTVPPSCLSQQYCRYYCVSVVHCCQIPPGLAGPVQPKKFGRWRKIRLQAGNPPNHRKKCSKKFLLQIFGPIFANYC